MARRPDEGHRLTDQELAKLERRIAKLFKQTADDVQETVTQYFESFKARDEEMKKLVGTEINGKVWTETDYKLWRIAQIGRGKRFEALRDKLAQRYTNANAVAIAYTNDATPGIYSLNRNYAAYTIEQVAGDVGFTLWDEQTVKRLLVEQPDLMPYYPKKRALKRGIDLAWGKKQISASIDSAILQGKSIKGIADDLQRRIETMNRDSAIRTARTAITGAQNAGRMDSYKAAEKMGIEMEREWVATLDGRTRHDHAMADGQRVGVDEPFTVGGYKIMYPGDPKGRPNQIYNCRCTMVSVPKGKDTSNEGRRAKDPVTGKYEIVKNMNYQQWYEMKEKQHGKETLELAIKETKNETADRKQFNEFKAILKKDAPKSFEKFQDMKYNDPTGWEKLKTAKKQITFVEKAPCTTTPKKFTEFMLKPDAKHSKDFFNVGYTKDDTMQLRYDVARQFDMSKAVDVKELEDGAKKFNIYMELGVTKKRMFRTGWIQDDADSLPRIVTGFRNNGGEKNDE